MILNDLLSTLIKPYWMVLEDEESNLIIERIVKTNSDDLSEYLDKEVYRWLVSLVDSKLLMFVLLKGVYRE